MMGLENEHWRMFPSYVTHTISYYYLSQTVKNIYISIFNVTQRAYLLITHILVINIRTTYVYYTHNIHDIFAQILTIHKENGQAVKTSSISTICTNQNKVIRVRQITLFKTAMTKNSILKILYKWMPPNLITILAGKCKK